MRNFQTVSNFPQSFSAARVDFNAVVLSNMYLKAYGIDFQPGFWLRGVQSLSNKRSFAALAFQPAALPVTWANGSSRTKLAYCHNTDS